MFPSAYFQHNFQSKHAVILSALNELQLETESETEHTPPAESAESNENEKENEHSLAQRKRGDSKLKWWVLLDVFTAWMSAYFCYLACPHWKRLCCICSIGIPPTFSISYPAHSWVVSSGHFSFHFLKDSGTNSMSAHCSTTKSY